MVLAHLDEAIQIQSKGARKEFDRLTASLSGAPDRLALLNALVLVGPSFSLLATSTTKIPSPYVAAVDNEIATLRNVPEAYKKEFGGIDVEIDKLALPLLQAKNIPDLKLIPFLQACTDSRLISLGRLINHLSKPLTILPEHITLNAEIQRALAFAVSVMIETDVPFDDWQQLASFEDPIARLTLLLALRTAVKTGLLGESAGQMVLLSMF
jgi:hypothetical protein